MSKKVLQVVLNQIYNPSNDWMQCTISCGNQKFSVSPLPPRSTRPLPQNILNASIYSESILPPAIAAKSAHILAGLQTSNIIIDALEINGDGFWSGIFKYGSFEDVIRASVSVRVKEIQGWFFAENNFYFTGQINPSSKEVHLSFYNDAFEEIEDVNGRISQIGRQYHLNLENSLISLNISTTTTSIQPPSLKNESVDSEKPSAFLSGHYRGFFEKYASSFEIHAELEATNVYTVKAAGTEESKAFAMEGFINNTTNTFLFVRRQRSGIIFYTGEASLQDSIFFSGMWKQRDGSGGATFIKCLPEG